MREASEVAERCVALLAVIERCNGIDAALLAWAENRGVRDFFSPAEKAFFYAPNPSHEDLVHFSWRSEGLVALLWALAHVAEMPALDEHVSLDDYPALQQAVADPQAFIAAAALREPAEIEEAESFLYEQHWRVRDAQLFGRPMPPELDAGIVYERRYALSWCTGWGADWDDVPTDT